MSRPVVSIVGRPNVGKSTLFNRIVRRREAIVDDEPGVTRDRKCVDAEWEGVSFVLMDTGGYVPKGKDVIEAGVARQVRLALEESDLVIFLTDCSTGITDIDFVGGQVPIVLSGSTLTAYSAGILPTGSTTVAGSPSDLFVNDENAIVFQQTGGSWSATLVPLSELSAPIPGEA